MILSHSIEETLKAGRELAHQLQPGDVVALQGNLGSGKTTLIKGIAQGLGAKPGEEVTSPTFALMHIYQTATPLYHFDLYRLESSKELADIGFDEFVSHPQAITCIEWPEKAKEFLPKKHYQVKIKIKGDNERSIEVKYA